MGQFSTTEYDQIERAVRDGRRVSLMRRGTEYIIIPLSVGMRGGREVIQARHSTTGDDLTIFVDDVDSFVVLR